MDRRMRRRILITATAFISLVAIAWAVVRDSTRKAVLVGKGRLPSALVDIVEEVNESASPENAVPSGKKHLQAQSVSDPDSQKNDPAAKNFVSVEFQTRGYCCAASQLNDPTALGGFGKSDNVAQRIEGKSSGKGLGLLAQPGVVTKFGKEPGMRVVLVNQTSEILAFPASDSRLSIIQEAQDADGAWKAVEYLPSSWCGNSHHRVFLKPAHFWSFSAPRYKGSLKTKLRFSMKLSDGTQLYSNVFDGSVNPNQFTMKQGHQATNIMDPYVD